jgi:predicted RNase H-like nuclease
MSQLHRPVVVGIDVGGIGKGFHAVALRDGQSASQRFSKAQDAANWCLAQDAQIIAVDAPCAWATSGGSRLAERDLAIDGATVQCFKTPTSNRARGSDFYGWVFNGEMLYQSLFPHWRLFDGTHREERTVIETFPHAVVCALAGRIVPAKPKVATRRRVLQEHGVEDRPLANIDFVDAGLCALTAHWHLLGRTRSFGDQAEGFIVVPDTRP